MSVAEEKQRFTEENEGNGERRNGRPAKFHYRMEFVKCDVS
jgi:hypothetical protein